jgi:hypothetical protein
LEACQDSGCLNATSRLVTSLLAGAECDQLEILYTGFVEGGYF